MMMFAKVRYGDERTSSNFYETEKDFVEDTFCPETEILALLPFEIRGKDYQERKDFARELAINFQYENDGETDFQLSCEEQANVERFFRQVGKRYGLLREFRENAIC